nr:hypothetical protein [Tanacetum cinerariifolium]
MIDQAMLRNSTNGDGSHSSGGGPTRSVQSVRACSHSDFMKYQPLNFRRTEGVVGLSRWTLGHDAAYTMTWETLKKKMTDKYCPRGEIKKLKIKLWNLKVKGNDVMSYTQRFQKLALMCTKFISDVREKVDKYIGGLPDNIHADVMSARPKTLDEAIEQNVAQDYTVGTGERNEYAGTLSLCNKCKFHRNGPCTTKTITCYECGKQRHYKSDCPELKNQNHGNQAGGTEARGMVYALGGKTNQDHDDIENDINA